MAHRAEQGLGLWDEWRCRMASLLTAHRRELVKSVAGRLAFELAPVMHPNGFIRCDLYRSSSGVAIRLHLWPVGSAVETGIHDHRWHFASLILAGAYVETKFAHCESAGTAATVECHRVDPSNVRVVSGAPVSLTTMSTKRFGAGMTNCGIAGEFHRVEPDFRAGSCVSLVVTAPPVAAAARVLASVEANNNSNNIHYANVGMRALRLAFTEGRVADVSR